MKQLFLGLLLATYVCGATVAQEESSSRDIEGLIVELQQLGIQAVRGDAKTLQQQQARIKLADQILQHPDKEEDHRLFALVTKMQALGIQFNTKFRSKEVEPDVIENYRKAIQTGLADEDERVVAEATKLQASFRASLFILEPDESKAKLAAESLSKLTDLNPDDPLTQIAKRLLLEQLWNSDFAEIAFTAMEKSDEKLARIVLDEVAGKTDRDKADFLWAKHFARYGDFGAQRRLAEMYETGKGTRINNSQAARWYGKLAQLGDMNAYVKIADFLLVGKGYSKDEKAAIAQYQTAAGAGSRLAKFKLGQCYKAGTGVEQSDKKWKKYIKEAADDASSFEVETIDVLIDLEEAAASYQIFYESLVKQNPKDTLYLKRYAGSLLSVEAKNAEQALEVIEKAIELAPENFDGLSGLQVVKATALKELGQTEQAASLFESVLPKLDDKTAVLRSLITCAKELQDDTKIQLYSEQLTEIENSQK